MMPPLSPASKNADERFRALQALAVGNDAESLPLFRNALSDVDSSVRAGAARILGGWAGRTPRPGDDADWNSIRARWAEMLSDGDPDVRFEAARGLILLDPTCDPAIRVLLDFLGDGETAPPMLAAVLNAIGAVDVPRIANACGFAVFLQHPQSSVRESAARALGTWGRHSLDLAMQLIPLLDDEEPFVREEAAKSLGQMGVSTPVILAALEHAGNDDDEVAAAAAREALSQLQEAGA